MGRGDRASYCPISHGNLLEEEERGETFDHHAICNVLVLRTVNFGKDTGRVLVRQDFCSCIVLWLQFLTVTAKSI